MDGSASFGTGHACKFCDSAAADSEWLLFKSEFWSAFLADNQNYPGRAIMILNRHASDISSLAIEEWEDLHKAMALLEEATRRALGVTNYNWTCLMNGAYGKEPYDPHVHWHMIPRYDHVLDMLSEPFVDELFGTHYTMADDYQLTYGERIAVTECVKDHMRRMLERSGDGTYEVTDG